MTDAFADGFHAGFKRGLSYGEQRLARRIAPALPRVADADSWRWSDAENARTEALYEELLERRARTEDDRHSEPPQA